MPASLTPPVLTRADAPAGGPDRPSDRELRPVVERLWQLYAHDLSQFRGTLPDEHGRYRPGRLPRYFEEEDRRVYLAEQDGAPVGFVMVRDQGDGQVLGEFFVVRALRRRGLGSVLARQVLESRPGRWEISFQEENPAAAAFWRRVAADLPGARTREERRPVPDKPHLPPDTWLVIER